MAATLAKPFARAVTWPFFHFFRLGPTFSTFPRVIRVTTPRDQSLPAQPISIQEAQSRKKSPYTFALLVNFPKIVCHA